MLGELNRGMTNSLIVGRRSENSFRLFRQNDGPKTDIAFNHFLKLFYVEVREPTRVNYINLKQMVTSLMFL